MTTTCELTFDILLLTHRILTDTVECRSTWKARLVVDIKWSIACTRYESLPNACFADRCDSRRYREIVPRIDVDPGDLSLSHASVSYRVTTIRSRRGLNYRRARRLTPRDADKMGRAGGSGHAEKKKRKKRTRIGRGAPEVRESMANPPLFPNTCEFDNKLAVEFSTAHSDVTRSGGSPDHARRVRGEIFSPSTFPAPTGRAFGKPPFPPLSCAR